MRKVANGPRRAGVLASDDAYIGGLRREPRPGVTDVISRGEADMTMAMPRIAHVASNWWALALGIYILMRPSVGAALLVTWVGVYALLAGMVTLMLAFRIRRWSQAHGGRA
jgi:hypothetical protein